MLQYETCTLASGSWPVPVAVKSPIKKAAAAGRKESEGPGMRKSLPDVQDGADQCNQDDISTDPSCRPCSSKSRRGHSKVQAATAGAVEVKEPCSMAEAPALHRKLEEELRYQTELCAQEEDFLWQKQQVLSDRRAYVQVLEVDQVEFSSYLPDDKPTTLSEAVAFVDIQQARLQDNRAQLARLVAQGQALEAQEVAAAKAISEARMQAMSADVEKMELQLEDLQAESDMYQLDRQIRRLKSGPPAYRVQQLEQELQAVQEEVDRLRLQQEQQGLS